MRPFYFNIFLIGSIFIFYVIEVLGQDDQSICRQLFEQSDLVIQGRIISKGCYETEMGVQFCSNSIEIDSIFKGKVLENELIEIPAHPARPTPTSRIISFSERCFFYLIPKFREGKPGYFEDNCAVERKDYIVFLKRREARNKEEDKSNSYNLTLTDDWLGFQPANTYLAIELRSFGD